jgi:hypothetical protein
MRFVVLLSVFMLCHYEYCHVVFVNIDIVRIDEYNLLTTYTHDSELQVITVPNLISYNSQIITAPAKPLSSVLCHHQPLHDSGF